MIILFAFHFKSPNSLSFGTNFRPTCILGSPLSRRMYDAIYRGTNHLSFSCPTFLLKYSFSSLIASRNSSVVIPLYFFTSIIPSTITSCSSTLIPADLRSIIIFLFTSSQDKSSNGFGSVHLFTFACRTIPEKLFLPSSSSEHIYPSVPEKTHEIEITFSHNPCDSCK